MIIIGIDPGKSGGVARLDTPCFTWRDPIVAVSTPDTAHVMIEMLKNISDFNLKEAAYTNVMCVAYIEQISTAFWGGAKNTGELMRNVGWWEMALAALRIPYKQVTAQVWQKAVGANKKPTKLVKLMTDKERSAWYRDKKNHNKILAQKLYPDIKVTHAIADALLIAEYGRMQESKFLT